MAKDTANTKKDKKHFFKDFKAELKKVIWPTPKQVVNNTVAVITIVILTAVIVFALDFVFEALNTQGIDRIRSLVTKTDDNTVTSDGENTTSDNTTSEDAGEGEAEGTETENSTTENTDSGDATQDTDESLEGQIAE